MDRESSSKTSQTALSPSPSVTIRCDEVSHEYVDDGSWIESGSARSVTALRDVSLEIRSGEVVGLTGPSGSGKSTILHAMAGLIVPTAGTVELLGTDLATRSDTERTRIRRESIGLVFQQFHLLPALTAAANVALPLVQLGYSRQERQQRATRLLEQVGLSDRADHRPGELSGGEQQRVAIARALVTDPEIVLADEPTGELDTETGMRVLDQLVDVANGRTVVLATHDERAVDRMDRVIPLLDGTVTDDVR